MIRSLLASALRLFFLQCSMNYERLQGLGIAVSMEPLVRPDRSTAPAAGVVRRAASFFNTHPYFAGLAVGALARAERDGVEPAQIERLRSALKGPLGAIGDRLIWAGFLPATASAALVVGVVVGPGWGVVTFLVLFNVPHLLLRMWALRAGWRAGVRVVTALRAEWLSRVLRYVGPAAALAVGFMLPIVASWLAEPLAGPARWGAAAVAAASFVSIAWLSPGWGALRVGMIALAAAYGLGWVW